MSTQQASPSSHTPTPGPWTYRKATQHFYIEGTNRSSGRRIATVHYVANGTTEWTSEANAAHIVHCVNVHDQLVAALKDMHEVLSDLLEDPHAEMTTQRYAALQAIDKSKQALAAAEKGA